MKKILFSFYSLFISSALCAQYGLKKLPHPINTDEYDEICPVMSYDEATLFFTRAGSPDFNKTLIENGKDLFSVLSSDGYNEKLRDIYTQVAGTSISNPIRSDFNQDIWMAKMEGNIEIYHPPMPINNAMPNSICSNYSRRNEYVLINEFPVNGGLKAGFSYTKRMDNGRFTIPIPIVIHKFNEKGSAINLSMSNDGQHIYIAMTGPSSYGDQDIFLSIKVMNNLYSEPINLGKVINSKYRESTPFISQDKNRIYFASNRPGGHGGMDIYYSERLDYTYRNWSEPKLLGQPINTENDESYPYVFLDENTIYFSSDREGTSDLFSAKMYRDDFLDRPIAVNINIRDENNNLIQGELYWQQAYKDEGRGFFRTNTGQYRYIIEDNIPMIFYARRRGTFSEKPMIDPQVLKNEGKHEIEIDLILPSQKFTDSGIKPVLKPQKKKEDIELDGLLPLETNRTIVLKNIYFAQSKPTVLEVSHPSLKQLSNVLKKRPHVQVRIEGHTDNVGNKKDLMTLSWDRAESIKEFLVKEGVLEENILAIGYGDSRPITNNATEEARKKNRRVEIRIIKQ